MECDAVDVVRVYRGGGKVGVFYYYRVVGASRFVWEVWDYPLLFVRILIRSCRVVLADHVYEMIHSAGEKIFPILVIRLLLKSVSEQWQAIGDAYYRKNMLSMRISSENRSTRLSLMFLVQTPYPYRTVCA